MLYILDNRNYMVYYGIVKRDVYFTNAPNTTERRRNNVTYNWRKN